LPCGQAVNATAPLSASDKAGSVGAIRDAIHAIGMVLAEHIYDVLKTEPLSQDPNAPYFAALERLTVEDWRRSQ
jgi:hypothetical protein